MKGKITIGLAKKFILVFPYQKKPNELFGQPITFCWQSWEVRANKLGAVVESGSTGYLVEP